MEKLNYRSYLSKNREMVDVGHKCCGSDADWACDIETAKVIFDDLEWQSKQSYLFNFDAVKCIKVEQYETFETDEDEMQNYRGYRAFITCNTEMCSNLQIKIEVSYSPNGYKWVHISTNH